LQQLNADLAARRIQRQQYNNRVAQMQQDRAKAKAIASSSRMELEKFKGAGNYVREAKGGGRARAQDGGTTSASGGVAETDKKRAQGGKMRLYDNEVRTMSSLVDKLDTKVAQLGKLALEDIQQGT